MSPSARRVLVVDDDEDILDIARFGLVHAGWEVQTALDGAVALARAAQWRPDAILLDVVMPDPDGPGTLALLRAHAATAAIPVVFMTARTDVDEHARLVSLGALGVIGKPFRPLSLGERLEALLAER